MLLIVMNKINHNQYFGQDLLTPLLNKDLILE